MFKSILKVIVFAIGLGTFAMSCEGRITKNQALKKSLAEYAKAKKITKHIYHPESYNEKAVDTILSNGYRVRLMTFTDMDKSILKFIDSEKALEKHYYRLVNGDLTVKYKNQEIFKKKINSAFVTQSLSIDSNKWAQYNIRDVWIDQTESLDKNLLCVRIEFCSVNSNNCKNFSLQINHLGEYDLYEIDKINN